MDKEKVFDAFRNCITEPKCKDCPWKTCDDFHQTKKIPLDLCLDILELLKEQKAVAPSTSHHLFICPVCKTTLKREQKFCHECGKRIKWEGR